MIQLLWLTLLAAHAGLAAMWWWMMPGGFPSTETAFWVNQVAPPIVIGLLLLALFARGRLSQALLPPVLVMIPAFWMAFGISARIVFFESFRAAWNVPFLCGAALAGLWVKQFRFRTRPVWLAPALALTAALAGWKLPATQRSPEPATAPDGAPFASLPKGGADHQLVKLSRDAQLRSPDGRVVIRKGPVILNVQPMLTFGDRSPDRFWTSLAPDGESGATTRTLTSMRRDRDGWTLFYKDEETSLLSVSTHPDAIEIDALSRITQPIFAHLASYAELTVIGHHQLSLAFSPVPGSRVEVPPAGAPARFAYLDASGTFHLAQAAAEKRGPYTEVASGKLGHQDPLTVTLYDDNRPLFVVTLDDFAKQASTQLSPAAGSGIPENAITWVRGGDSGSAPVVISFSLASTEIGRGTQSVGYAPGVYRDRVKVSLP